MSALVAKIGIIFVLGLARRAIAACQPSKRFLKYPARFTAMAALPIQEPERAEHAVTELDF